MPIIQQTQPPPSVSAIVQPTTANAKTADTLLFGGHIQRTMGLLATSIATHHNKVKVLFYGQSISEQEWSREVADDLRRRFPNADLITENRAIGGFAANLLKRTVEHDLYSFYPDLVLVHDYGGDADYEEIIRGIRTRTTAEVLIQSDHIAGNLSDEKAQSWHDRHSYEWLPALAQKYGCEMVEIRRPWRRYLKDNNLEAAALLSDGTHLNERGNKVLANLMLAHLVYLPLRTPTDQDSIHTFTVGKDVDWQNGVLTLPFDGNRIDLIADTQGLPAVCTVQIDGKKPSEFPELYSISRPSPTVGVGWPAIIRVGHQTPLIEEDWTARITSINDTADVFTFDVSGSRTGKDGSGKSGERFVSTSGRVVIEPGDWFLKASRDYSKQVPPVGFEVHWKVVPQFVDTYQPMRILDVTRENATTVAQGLANGRHTLTLTAASGSKPAVQAIRVYRPPVK